MAENISKVTLPTGETYIIRDSEASAKNKAQDDAIAELQKHKQENADWNSTSGVSQILNKPHLYVLSCEMSAITKTVSDPPIDAVVYFSILHNKDTIIENEVALMLDGKRHPCTGYRGDEAVVSMVLGMHYHDFSYKTISRDYNALRYNFKKNGTYQVF